MTLKWIVTVLYGLSFGAIAFGLRLVIVGDREVTDALITAERAGAGIAPPDEGTYYYSLNPDLHGPTAARYVAVALKLLQQGNRVGAWIALAGGVLGLVATLITVWT